MSGTPSKTTDTSVEAPKKSEPAAAEAAGAKTRFDSEVSEATKPPTADKPAEASSTTAAASTTTEATATAAAATAAATAEKPGEKPGEKKPGEGDKPGESGEGEDEVPSLYERTLGKVDSLAEIQSMFGFGKRPTATDKAKLPAVVVEDPNHKKLGSTATDVDGAPTDAAANPTDAAKDPKEKSFTESLMSAANWSMKALACTTPLGFIAAGASECIDLFESGFDSAFNSVFGKQEGSGRHEDAVGKTNNAWKFEKERQQAVAEIQKELNLTNASDASGSRIDMPPDAIEIGKVSVVGQEVTVMRGSNGETVLQDKSGKIIGKDKGDGKYELLLNDEQKSKLDFKISQGADGKFTLDSLDRVGADGKPLQKVENGVIYNYNYDKNGKQSVDAVLDETSNLSPEQLRARIDEIKKTIGDNGQAMIRYLDADGKPAKLHLQNYGADTQIETQFFPKPDGTQIGIATIRHKGQEYQVVPGENGAEDQLQIHNPDGSWSNLSDAQRQAISKDLEALRKVGREARARARGDETARPGGIAFIRRNGETIAARTDAEGNEISTITIPDDDSKPIELTNNDRKEVTTVQGDKIDTKTEDGKQVWDFDPDKGLRTQDFTANDRGLTHIPTGTNIDLQGNVYDGAGNKIADGSYGGSPENTAKLRAELEIKTTQASIAASKAIALGSLALSCVSNPAVMEQLARAGLAVIDSALGACGGMSVILSLAKCTPLAALSRAGSENQALNILEKSGVYDSTSRQMAMTASTGSTYISSTSAARHIIEKTRPDLKVVA